MRFAASTRKLAPIYAQNNTRTPNDNSHAAIPMRSASTDSKTPYNYTHTSTPKAASSHRYTAAKKNDKPTAAAPAAQTRYLSSSPAATLHGKTQGFVLRLPPQNMAHATSCSHYNAVRSINSQTCTYLRTEQHQNTKWQQSCSHSNAICHRRFQNTPQLRTHKHTQSSFEPPLHCGKKNDKPTAAAPVAHTRYLSSSPAATLHGKTQGFVLRLPPQDIAHATSCSHYNAVRSINSQTCTYLRTEQHQNTKWQQSCSHSNAICKHRFQNSL